MTLTELVRTPGIPTTSKLEILQRADRMFLRHGRHYDGRLTEDEIDRLTAGVEMFDTAKGAIAEAATVADETDEDRRADDEYFRTGTRYPGQ